MEQEEVERESEMVKLFISFFLINLSIPSFLLFVGLVIDSIIRDNNIPLVIILMPYAAGGIFLITGIMIIIEYIIKKFA